MGVPTRLVVHAANETLAAIACQNAFARVAELEDVMSDYRPTSELMRLCDRAGRGPVRISDELFTVLSRAQELARQTDGAFDVTVGPYSQLWRRAREDGRLPSERELQEASRLVGWRKLRLDPQRKTATLETPGMRLDLGGIGKGYAGDQALQVLERHGITSALYEAGGDIVVSNSPPNTLGWMVDVIDPREAGKSQQVPLANAAVSTSGDTEQFIEIGGVRYSHIVDPRTGLGVTNRVMVTVIARDGITSDSLATAASILGPREGQRLVRQYPQTSVTFRRAE
jgi:FAD:protein FMN transferase